MSDASASNTLGIAAARTYDRLNRRHDDGENQVGDLDTSMMLLLNKASRKIHRNSLNKDHVQQWLRDACAAYDTAGIDAHACHIFVVDDDDEEDATLAIAVIMPGTMILTAGKGPGPAVNVLAADAVASDPSEAVARARIVVLAGTEERWSGRIPLRGAVGIAGRGDCAVPVRFQNIG